MDKKSAAVPFARLRRGMAWVLGGSLLLTMLLLVMEGRFADALPLHLCGMAALAAAVLALYPGQALLDLLWYLGMPGAFLALMFPAPATCRLQFLFDASYLLTHTMILVIPSVVMVCGLRPRAGKSIHAFLLLQAAALGISVVNMHLGTDFLFLSAPPAGTPLEPVFACGYPAYLIVLETLMLLICRGMDRLAGVLFHEQNGRK